MGTLERCAQEIALSELDLEPACLAFDELLHRVLQFDIAAWSTHDPATGLFTSCTMSGLPKDLGREAEMFRWEFGEGEPNAYRDLIAEGRTVAVLSRTTGGALEQAGRYRELLGPYGCTDEIRAVLWADGHAWGSATLYRSDGWFTERDAQLVASVAPHAGHGLRLVLLRAAAARPEAVADPPGILKVSAEGCVTAMTVPAQRWLDVGGPPLVTAANAVAAAVRGNQDWSGASSRLPLPGPRLLSLHAARTAGDDHDIAVIVETARSAEVTGMLVDGYGLTSRQREVLGLLLLGRSMTQIARMLGISEHTANDHRKAVYSRIGVGSRSELAARLQTDQYAPRTQAGVPPSPYGGFLETRPSSRDAPSVLSAKG